MCIKCTPYVCVSVLTKHRLCILILSLTSRLSVLIAESCCILSTLLIYSFYQYFLISGDKLYVFFLSLVLNNNTDPSTDESFLLICCFKTLSVEETRTYPNIKGLFMSELLVMYLSICKYGGVTLEK